MRYLILLFCWSFCFDGIGQSFTVYNHSIQEGFPSTEVYDVFQDSKGFLWFATDNGVARFDGSVVETFHVKNGLSDPVVFNFVEDSKNRIWFRTFSGKLSYYDNGKIYPYAYNSHLSNFNQYGYIEFLVRENDELVFTAPTVFGKINSKGKLTFEKLPEFGLYYFSIDDKHLLNLSSLNAAINKIIINGNHFAIKPTNPLFINRVYRWVKWRGLSFFNLNDDIFCYNGKRVFKAKATGMPIISLSVDKNDALWVGYMNGGAERFENVELRSGWKPDFIRDKSVTKVLQDHEGGFWFTTLENGAYHVPNMQLVHHSLQSTSRIKSVVQHAEGIVLGDQTGRVYRIDTRTLKETLVAEFEPPITSMHQAKNSNLFVSTSYQIRILDTDYKIKANFPIASAIDFTDDDAGDTWCYGGNRVRKFHNNLCVYTSMGVNVPYRAFLLDKDKFIMADRTGLHLRDTLLTKTTRIEKFSDFKITGITALDDSTLVMNTIGSGFLLVDKRTLDFKIYNSENKFIADNIYDVVIDYSDLWLGTEKGLVKVAISSLRSDSLTFDHLTKKNGLISDKIDFLKLVNRNIWVFSGNHFSLLPVTLKKFIAKKPVYYLREVKVNNDPKAEVGLANLRYNENNVTISIGFISFNSQNIYIRYRLSEAAPWSYTSDRTLSFSSLSPNHYTLSLQYSTDRLNWYTAENKLSFNILNPWWNQWYFYLVLIVLSCLIIFIYLRHQQSIFRQKNHYLRIITEHQQKLIQSEIVTLERERNRIAKELHDRVGTNLTAIKMSVNQILQTHKDVHAAEVEEQFQIAIHEIKEIIYALTPPSLERYGLFTSLKNYIGKLDKRIPINISLKTFGKETGGGDLNIILFRVVQELLNNSIKHSFAKNITIHINAFEDVMNLVYEDDGIGFSYDPLQSGLGLDSIESRINSLNGTLKFESGKFGICYTIDIPITINKEVV